MPSYCLNPSCPRPNNPADMKFCQTCGTKLLLKDRYRATKPIGQGGFGKTFLAVDEDKPSKPFCVIKQFYPQAQGTNTVQKAAELFEREAIRLDELGQHSQIPELLAFLTQDTQQYLVQEFIAGKDLEQELAQNGVFNEAQIIDVLNNMLPILQFIHSQQVIHRDIKPENIIRRSSNQELVLVDFGAAKAITHTALAQTGTTIGSAGYTAPEQAMGHATYSSDIYGLGVTCIHLLTGLHPFDLYDAYEGEWIWRKHLKATLRNNLGQIIDKMLASVASQRYSSAMEVLQDLSASEKDVDSELQALQSQFSSSPPPTPPVTSSDNVDAELQQLESKFVQKPQPAPPPQPKSDVDSELEQIQAKFQNSPHKKKQSNS